MLGRWMGGSAGCTMAAEVSAILSAAGTLPFILGELIGDMFIEAPLDSTRGETRSEAWRESDEDEGEGEGEAARTREGDGGRDSRLTPPAAAAEDAFAVGVFAWNVLLCCI